MVNRTVIGQGTRSGYRGFSLIELMVVVALLGVVMGIAVPGLRDLMGGQKVKSASFDLINAVMIARNEAGKRNATISILATSSHDLASGWCVIYGTSATCDMTTPTAETMRIQQPYSTLGFTWKTTAGRINFNTSGRLSSGAAQIEIADLSNSSLKSCVTIDVTGTASSRSGAC